MINISRNTAIDTLRNTKRVSIHSINDYVTAIDKEHQLESKEDKIGLKEVIYKLKKEHKIMIELAYFSGYTQDEIAKHLNIPLGTVKTRTRAALLELRRVLC